MWMNCVFGTFNGDGSVDDYRNLCSYCYQNTRATVRVFAFCEQG